MKIKYVGAKPVVSQHGVSFDQSKPDRHTFLSPTIELIEELENPKTDSKGVLVIEREGKTYNDRELLEKLKALCNGIEENAQEREEESEKLIEEYVSAIEKSKNLSADEKRAWLGNVKIMKNYYLQYVTNEMAYKCLLKVLADRVYKSGVSAILFPIKRNYGIVFSHLAYVLAEHRPPLDTSMRFEERNGETYGLFLTNRKAKQS